MIRYMSTVEIAHALGKRESSIRAKHLPEPDAMTWKTPGWLPATVEKWAATVYPESVTHVTSEPMA